MNRVVLLGLAVFTAFAGLSMFLRPGLPSWLPGLWIIGGFLLVAAVSYQALFTRASRTGLSFLVLGIIGLNALIQTTGGFSSPFLLFYFPLIVPAAFWQRSWAALATGIIVAIEALNLLLAGGSAPVPWPAFAGFAVSLAGVALLSALLARRITREARRVRASYDKLLDDADAVDPLAGGRSVDALTETSRRATRVGAAREREGSFGGLMDALAEIVPAHTSALFLDDRDDGMLSLRAIRSKSSFIADSGVTFSRGSGLIGICAAQNAVQYVPDMVIPITSLGYYRRAEPVRSFLALPIGSQGSTEGVLAVDSLERDAFPASVQASLTRFLPFFGQLIENVRNALELDIRAKNFAALHEMSEILSGSLEVGEVLDALTERLRSVVPYETCVFLLCDEKAGEASIASRQGYDRKDTVFPIAESAILSHMLAQWRERSICATHYDPDLGDRGADIGLFPRGGLRRPLRSLFGRPLIAHDRFVGAAFLGANRADAFTDYHRNFLSTLLNQVAMVVDNSLLHRRIRDLARTDGLTGLLNHRTFMEKLAEEYKRLDREPRPFSVLLMDIDKFKGVNDRYGHPVGDRAIKAVAGTLHKTGRGSDFAARYGGEEFAVGMTDTDARGAAQMGERIRALVEKTPVTEVFDGELRITVSVGVASFPADTKDPAELVAFADNALYRAKRSGRNRVCTHAEAVHEPQEEHAVQQATPARR